MADQPDGKVAPKMVRESDLIALKKAEKKIQVELETARKDNARLLNELKIAKASGTDDEDVKAIQDMLIKKSQETQDKVAEIEQREASLKERERESLVKAMASQHSVDYEAIKDAEDPEKEALKLNLERLNKEKGNPTPAEKAFEVSSGSPPSKKSVADMNPQEFKDEESRLKAEYNAKHK